MMFVKCLLMWLQHTQGQVYTVTVAPAHPRSSLHCHSSYMAAYNPSPQGKLHATTALT
jgi:hypothetical protein